MSHTDKNLKNGWKIVLKYLFEYKNKVVLLSLLGIISAIAHGTIPYIIGQFFDAVLSINKIFVGTEVEMSLWLFFVLVFGIVQLSANIVEWRSEISRKEVGFNIYAAYLSKSWGHLMKLPKMFFNDKKIGSVTDTLSRSAGHLEVIIGDIIIDLTPQFLSLFVGIAIVFYIHPLFGIILLGCMLIYATILIKIVPATIDLSKKARDAWGTIWGDNFDSVLNLDTVKKFTAEDSEFQKIYKGFSKVTNMSLRLQKHWAGASFYQKLIVILTQVSFFIVSVYFVRSEVITLGELIALNGYATMVFVPFMTLGRRWHQVQNGLIYIEEAEKILDTPTENYHPKNALDLNNITGNVEFKNIDFYYNKKDGNVLNNINLKVKAGEIIALVGESGVGKSTITELLSAYHFAQKGEILIDDIDVKKIDLLFLRKNIAIVPQEVSLFNDTIEVNIKYGKPDATFEEVKKAAEEAHADEFIQKFPQKYEQLVGERGVKLSVGQKQRIAIARAVLRDPKILILDEPTSALDSVTEKYITASLKKLMEGKTTFIVAHRLSTVRDADRIVVFDKGKIVESGQHDELMKNKNGIYQHLYDLHTGAKT